MGSWRLQAHPFFGVVFIEAAFEGSRRKVQDIASSAVRAIGSRNRSAAVDRLVLDTKLGTLIPV